MRNLLVQYSQKEWSNTVKEMVQKEVVGFLSETSGELALWRWKQTQLSHSVCHNSAHTQTSELVLVQARLSSK